MKIGILTYFRAINYGAYLQAYALSHRLNEEDDIEAELIDFHMPEEDEYYQNGLKWKKHFSITLYNRKRYDVFQSARKFQEISEENLCGNDIDEFISFVYGKYDVIIVGSDEVWRINGIRGFPAPYFLPGNLGCIKVSYAASGFNRCNSLTAEKAAFVKECLDDFAYIGVRESESIGQIRTFIADEVKVHLNFDPCFIYNFAPDPELGRSLIKKYYHVSGKRKVIAIMYTERPKDGPVLEKYLKHNFGDKCDFISLYVCNKEFRNNPSVAPLEWIDIIAAADGAISMFYHGACFAMIAGTPFYAVETRSGSKEESKLYDLLNRLDLLSSFSFGLNDAIENEGINNFMNSVAAGNRTDFSNVLRTARKEFDEFISVLRTLAR